MSPAGVKIKGADPKKSAPSHIKERMSLKHHHLK